MARTEDPREGAGTEEEATPVQGQVRLPQQLEKPEHIEDKEMEEQAQQQQQELEAAAQAERQKEQRRALEKAPKITVIGIMDNQVALRLGWRQGMIAISQSRFKFLKNELGIEVNDDPDEYLF